MLMITTPTLGSCLSRSLPQSLLPQSLLPQSLLS